MPELKSWRVMIFDDEPDKAQGWRAQLIGFNIYGLEVITPTNAEIQSTLDALYQRRQDIDKGKPSNEIPCELDSVDVLVVDFDLRHLDDHCGFATGEEIAYSARLFSRVKIIVVVNHPNMGLNNFDLTLQRDREFRGDVYVGHKQVGNPGLWIAEPGHDGFLPWSWPVLLEDVCTFQECVSEIKQNFQKPVLNYFGLDQPETRPSPEMLAYLGIKRDEDKSMSELAKLMTFVRPKDLETLGNDEPRHVHVVTALLRRWFRRWLLPPQTLFADMPHIALTLPWGVLNYENQDTWNRLALCGRSDKKCDLQSLLSPEIVGAQFSHIGWTGRPTFTLRRARASIETNGIPMSRFRLNKMPDLVFAEDLSRFIPAGAALPYSVTLDGEPQSRNVSSPDNVEIRDENFHLADVVYSPQSLML